ncbi:MAG: glycosyltransferase family 4 protein [Methanosarcina barkeri]|nr:glycosyltransferase family 4 protein [Methanosarcina sp. ERenArc_MAG2]
MILRVGNINWQRALYKSRRYLDKFLQFIGVPLVLAGKFVGLFLIPYFRSQLFFVFPYYHIGGAEKVHIKIISCLKERNPIVFFTNKSKNSALKQHFTQSAKTFDFSYFNNSVFIYFWAGVLCTIINNNENSIVFGCNNRLFYKLLPYLKPQTCCIDLIHAFGGIENFSLLYVDRLDKRVVINKQTLRDMKDQYRLCGVAEKMNERIFLIENCVQIPEKIRRKNNESTLKILYVGRGTKEKRVNLIGKISHLCHQKELPVEFFLVGDVINSIDPQYRKYCTFLGEVVDENKLSEIYNSSEILLLVSSSEGFPLVIMEAMARSVVTISTDVGGISEHIHNGCNGFLIKNESEDLIVTNVCEVISELVSNEFLRNKISLEAYEYAKANFNCKKFCSNYEKLFWGK